MMPRKLTRHHVPPTSTCKDPSKQFVLMRTEAEHRSYHILFSNLATYEECCEVLRKYWWTKPGDSDAS